MNHLNQTGKLWEYQRDYWESVKRHLESGVPYQSMFQQGNLNALFPTGQLAERVYILHSIVKGIEGGWEFIATLSDLNIGTDKIRKQYPIANQIFDHPVVKQNHPTEFLLALSYLTLSQLYKEGWDDFAKKVIIGELTCYCKIN